MIHSDTIVSIRCAWVMMLAFGTMAPAQTPTHVYHPGDMLRISVTFDGPDAGKIQRAAFAINTSESAKNQPGFAISLYTQESKLTAPNTFEISVKIPENQASGDYLLTMIRGFVAEPEVMLEYHNTSGDFKERTYTIVNRDHLVKPTIKDIKEP